VPVNIINLPGLNVLDFKETETDGAVFMRSSTLLIGVLIGECENKTPQKGRPVLFTGGPKGMPTQTVYAATC